MKRGEIWTFVGYGYGTKPRPGILLQNIIDDFTPSVTLVPITTTETDGVRIRPFVTVRYDDGDRQSQAMVDKILTTRRASLGKQLGKLTKREMKAIELAIMSHLGIGARPEAT